MWSVRHSIPGDHWCADSLLEPDVYSATQHHSTYKAIGEKSTRAYNILSQRTRIHQNVRMPGSFLYNWSIYTWQTARGFVACHQAFPALYNVSAPGHYPPVLMLVVHVSITPGPVLGMATEVRRCEIW